LEKACEKKNEQEQKQSTLSVTQDQIEQARQMLVGKSKSYRERYAEISKEITTNSQNIPAIPDTSSKEKSTPLYHAYFWHNSKAFTFSEL